MKPMGMKRMRRSGRRRRNQDEYRRGDEQIQVNLQRRRDADIISHIYPIDPGAPIVLQDVVEDSRILHIKYLAKMLYQQWVWIIIIWVLKGRRVRCLCYVSNACIQKWCSTTW